MDNAFAEQGFAVREIALVCEVLPGQGTKLHIDRPTHGLVYYYASSSVYRFASGQSLHAAPGRVLYLPEKSTYQVVDGEKSDTHCIAINFTAQKPVCYPPFFYEGQSALFQERFESALRARRALHCGAQAQAMACLYAIIAHLQQGINELRPVRASQRKIAPAVEWMETHFTDPELTIAQLAEKCGMSDVYFRQLFKTVYGATPLHALHTLRLRCAKERLAAGGCTVAQAAESAGFADASAFYRAFRARYHTTPKKLLSLEREDAGV